MKLSVQIPTHAGHRRFLGTCVEHCKMLDPSDITVLYDNGFKMSKAQLNLESYLPPSDVCNEIDSILLIKRDNSFGGVTVPWLFQQRDAMGLAYSRNSDLILSINGDCIITKPDNFKQFIEKFVEEKYDLCPCHYNENNIGTMGFLMTKDAYIKVFTHLIEIMYTIQTNAESRLAISSKELGIKVFDTGFLFDRSFSKNESVGFWNKEFGFMHLHGTEKFRMGNKIKPLEEKYYDKRFLRAEELKSLVAYWKSSNLEDLYKYGYWRR